MATDRDSNNISLFHQVDQLNVPEPPLLQGDDDEAPIAALPFLLVILFARSDMEQPEAGQARVMLAFPDGETHARAFGLEIDLESASRTRAILEMSGLPVRGEGVYRFVIETVDEAGAWKQLAECPVQVEYLDED